MQTHRKLHWRFIVATVALVGWACSDQSTTVTAPDVEDGPFISVVSQDALAAVIVVQEAHTPNLLRTPGVVGTAVGITDDGTPAVKLLVTERGADVPEQLDGFPVEVVLTGEFFALQEQVDPQAKPTCGKRNQPPCPETPGLNERHPRPVPIGVSVGHPAITAGTYGARVSTGAGVFMLSNNHVFADVNAANIGDVILQPGTFDGGTTASDVIATLSAFVPISFSDCSNVVDAAIAATTTDEAENSTPDGIGYGTPKSQTVAAALNMSVMKVGRTTGFTTGSVAAVNATVNVNYGASNGTACFVNQIVITPGSFSAGGDSGSLVVARGRGRDKSDDRKPVGLLFAGSASATIINPIDAVLTAFDATIDGN